LTFFPNHQRTKRKAKKQKEKEKNKKAVKSPDFSCCFLGGVGKTFKELIKTFVSVLSVFAA